MPTGRQGFTLIELTIVVSVIGIVASIAVPNMLSARRNANENSAIATLKSIASAQAQIQASVSIDANNNGNGEYAYFAEMAGGIGVRVSTGKAGTDRLKPAVLSASFNRLATGPSIWGGMVTKAGYKFQIFLPHRLKIGLPEADGGGVNVVPPDPTEAENLWCCYAWPTSYGNTGSRAFFVNQRGDILQTNNRRQRYSGTTRFPRYYSAFKRMTYNLMGSTAAVNTTAWDLQRWVLVN